LGDDLLSELLTAGKRQPQRGVLMQLDAGVLAVLTGVREQPINARAPVTAVELHLAQQALDRVPSARLVSDTRREVGHLADDLLCIGDPTAQQEKGPEPVSRVERQARQNAPPGLLPDVPAALQRLVEPACPPKDPRTRDQRRQVRLLVETTRRSRALLGRAQHRVHVILLVRSLVLDSERLEVRGPRTIVRAEKAPSALGGLVCCDPSTLAALAAPEIEYGLLRIELEVQQLVAGMGPARPGEICPRAVAVVARERGSRRLEERARPLQRLLRALGEQKPPLERDVVSRQRGRKRGDLVVQRQHGPVGRLRPVRDRHEQVEPVVAEQGSLRRAHEAIRKIERRQPGRMSMAECLSKASDVASGNPCEPVPYSAMDVDTALVGELVHHGRSDQIVRQPHRASRLESDTARHELVRRVLAPFSRPIVEARDICQRQRPPRDGKQAEQRGGVGARAAKARRHEMTGVGLGARSLDEGFEPERRSPGALGELASRCLPDLRRERGDELDRIGSSQRPELDLHEAFGGQHPTKRCRERRGVSRRSPGCDQGKRWPVGLGGPDEVVAQREREVVDPLQVVDQDKRRTAHAEDAVCGFEHLHPHERRAFLTRIKHQRAEPAAGRSELSECTQQVSGRCERHLPLRFVADDAKAVRRLGPVGDLGQKPALPAPRVADDHRGRDLTSLGPRGDLAE
jgi:hypothetical protein